jgi:uncharacterized protein (UPF0248 family)
MRTSHALLLRLRHDPQFDFSRVSVEYLNRGAPNDRSVISGEEILKLEPGWMEVASPTGIACIPYHRIRRILYEGTTMWELGSEVREI